MTTTAPLPLRSPLRAVISLSLPIIAVNLGMMSMGTVDTLMIGRVSAEALAAVALGNIYFQGFAMFGIGILLGLDPILSQALGAGDQRGAELSVQRGLALAAVISIPIMGAVALAQPILTQLHQPAAVMPLVGEYCLILVPSVLPFLAFNVGRQTLQAMHRVAPVVWAILIANLLNIGLNQWLIFGGGGVPALGVSGSAWATSISRFAMVALLYLFGRTSLRPVLTPWHPESARRSGLFAQFRLGLPVGIQIEIEFAAFSVVALLMGTFGTVAVAGHQIALNLASLTFMVPMGVGMGAAVVVGRAVGGENAPRARAAARAALGLGAGFMLVSATIFLLWPHFLASLYSIDTRVVAFAATLLPIAGLFQVFDGLQVVSAGILRGLGDTTGPMVINLVGFAIVGISASILLAYRTPLGPPGLWWGLVIGLAAVAAILLIRVKVALGRTQRRIVV